MKMRREMDERVTRRVVWMMWGTFIAVGVAFSAWLLMIIRGA